ncbi:uncharacterized protein Tco025E_04483 [Trypanosoma conorhini]|uniref:Cilia- and flagella-associated protein 418 n=1 Tax=Trypanosoma conorhini TaxID=83891 RepID=A0A422PM17_9TRYP|nr:uncharacterized protein Tco025E_04483 [Trypanosoma conorhini]RNF18741.1 hypothetical protein Tco025E_04483 [Trypanosoma conorhini]
MSDVDQLIEELFPKVCTELTSGASKPSVTHELPASKGDWDASDEEDKNAISAIVRPARPPASVNPRRESNSGPSKSYFDESDEDDAEAEVAASSSSFAVPFPFLPANVGSACVGKCFVTNMGAKLLQHPTIAQLLFLAQGEHRSRLSQKQLLEGKGAFYAINAKFGNGASDKYAEDMACHGGCPIMICRRCNYGVVRLQGAAWQDGGGTMDLYLTVRNYYPDWSRLVSSYPVGQTKNGEQNRVLRSSVGCAAYCCQCSWLTVSSEQETIETRPSDSAGYVGREDSRCFATQLPLPQEERRRPPLWVCRGHVPHF